MTGYSWHRRAQDSLVGASNCTEKRPDTYGAGHPTHLVKGRGCTVWDADGKRYLDFMMGHGTTLLGYANDRVGFAMVEQLQRGATLSLQSVLEVEVAEKVKELFPFIGTMRFFKDYAAARHAAWEIAGGPMDLVVPIELEDSPERVETLKAWGSKVVFDETVSGFRFKRFSASVYYGVEPDVVILGGAIANGMPLYVVGGKPGVDLSGLDSCLEATETVTLAAAKATMTLLQTKYSVDELWLKGQDFLSRFNSIWPEAIRLQGYPTYARFQGSREALALFQQEAALAGVLFGEEVFFSFPHLEEYELVLGLCRDIMTRIKTDGVTLKGPPPKWRFL